MVIPRNFVDYWNCWLNSIPGEIRAFFNAKGYRVIHLRIWIFVKLSGTLTIPLPLLMEERRETTREGKKEVKWLIEQATILKNGKKYSFLHLFSRAFPFLISWVFIATFSFCRHHIIFTASFLLLFFLFFSNICSFPFQISISQK